MAYHHDVAGDTLWFRIGLHDLPNPDAFGTNLILDIDGDPENGGAWWGANDTFRYDRLVTAWVTRRGEGFDGTIGIGDASGAANRNYTNLDRDNLALAVDAGAEAVYLGIQVEALGAQRAIRFVRAVGSNQSWNDDIPDSGSVSITLGGM